MSALQTCQHDRKPIRRSTFGLAPVQMQSLSNDSLCPLVSRTFFTFSDKLAAVPCCTSKFGYGNEVRSLSTTAAAVIRSTCCLSQCQLVHITAAKAVSTGPHRFTFELLQIVCVLHYVAHALHVHNGRFDTTDKVEGNMLRSGSVKQ